VRRFGLVAAFFTIAAAAGCSGSVGTTPSTRVSSPPLAIQHIIIMVQENRSFDNIFAGFPGADTTMQGPCKPLRKWWCRVAHEVPLRPVELESNHLPGGRDICHTHHCFELECDLDSSNVCRNDGFDLMDKGEYQTGIPNRLYPYRYVERSESKPYWDLARQYTLADRMFSTDTASSFIAHQQLIAGTVSLNRDTSVTDQPDNTPWGCDAPAATTVPLLLRSGRYIPVGSPRAPFPCFTEYQTIAELLDARNISWKYYVWALNDDHAFGGVVWNAFDAIKKVRYDPKEWAHISIPTTNVFSDLKNGGLPQVSWVIPTLCDSDHPGSGANRGPLWVTEVVNAIGTSRYWKNTAVVLVWDDWGGWYDNVPPPQVNYHSLGFRVPMIVISPYAKPHYVSHTQYDFGSILKLIEQNFGLGSLGVSDATANSMTDVFDFTQQPIAFKPAPLPHVLSCPVASDAEFIKINGAPPG
jgi:phospholipase C